MATPPKVLCGSISQRPSSLGAMMHEAGYRALGLPYTYVPFAVQHDLEGALRGMRALGIRGLGVAVPFKLQVIALLDHLDDLAARIGAVNTIVNDSGTLTGYNTDAWGAARALEEAMALPDRRVVVVGAGGAARACAFAFRQGGMKVHVANRTPEKAIALVDELNRQLPGPQPATASGLAALDDLSTADAVVNASVVGMEGSAADSPIAVQALHRDLVVMDIVYKPLHTALLKAAASRGCRTIHGGRMLLYQACRQFELYSGQPAPRSVMDEALQSGVG